MNEYKNIYQTLSEIDSPTQCQEFITDLCTPAERQAMEGRWLVCQILSRCPEKSYAQIHKETGVSITTIARVSRFLKQEPHGGYRSQLEERH